jgi:hypothetical protein
LRGASYQGYATFVRSCGGLHSNTLVSRTSAVIVGSFLSGCRLLGAGIIEDTVPASHNRSSFIWLL